jgi:hypothetical protein
MITNIEIIGMMCKNTGSREDYIDKNLGRKTQSTMQDRSTKRFAIRSIG